VKALSGQSSYPFTAGSAVFDGQNLMSSAGLAPVLKPAENDGLSRLIGEHVHLSSTRVGSRAVNATGKLTSIITAMMCGADSIDDGNVLGAAARPGFRRGVSALDAGGLLARVHLRARVRWIPCSTAPKTGICSSLPRPSAVAAVGVFGVWTSRSIAQFANVAEVT
jgi:hypothetical protein